MSRCLFYIHVVWATLHREPLLTEEREQDVFRMIIATAPEAGIEVIAVNGMPDHVHMLIKTGSTVDMPPLMKQVKGVTSAMLNRQMKPDARFRWQDGYYAATVTPSHVPKVAAYIQRQKAHHAAGTTHPLWEQADETAANA